MDPQACWQRFLDACNDNDIEEAIQSLLDLEEWLSGGGFQPKGISLSTVRNLADWIRSRIDILEIKR